MLWIWQNRLFTPIQWRKLSMPHSAFAKPCATLCNPTDCSIPSSSVLHCLPVFAQIHVRWVSDAFWPSQLNPLLLPSIFPHLFQWVCSWHQMTPMLDDNQYQSLCLWRMPTGIWKKKKSQRVKYVIIKKKKHENTISTVQKEISLFSVAQEHKLAFRCSVQRPWIKRSFQFYVWRSKHSLPVSHLLRAWSVSLVFPLVPVSAVCAFYEFSVTKLRACDSENRIEPCLKPGPLWR